MPAIDDDRTVRPVAISFRLNVDRRQNVEALVDDLHPPRNIQNESPHHGLQIQLNHHTWGHDVLDVDRAAAHHDPTSYRRHAGTHANSPPSQDQDLVVRRHFVRDNDSLRGRVGRFLLAPLVTARQVRDEAGQIIDVAGPEAELPPVLKLLMTDLPRRVGSLNQLEYLTTLEMTNAHPDPTSPRRQIFHHAKKLTTIAATPLHFPARSRKI